MRLLVGQDWVCFHLVPFVFNLVLACFLRNRSALLCLNLAVTGGPGAYGGYVIQLAKADGLVVIADCAESDRTLLQSLDADIIVSRGFKDVQQRDIKFTATWVTRYDGAYEKLDLLREQVEQGILSLRVADSVAAEDASIAHERLERGGTRGRMVIAF